MTFFRYICERYSCILETIDEYQIPDFDNVYLDMNDLFYTGSHPSIIFNRINYIFQSTQPKKIFYVAVDGVAPRAKMNQQRSKRFCTDREKKAAGEKLSEAFDSNCITPGTEWMATFDEQLKFFLKYKMSTDNAWASCRIIYSGHQTPGEGQHKILDYIRYLQAQPDYDPNTRHCLYGLDADLIMLSLCTHEPNFSILREEFAYGSKQVIKIVPDTQKFLIIHISLLRNYLNIEFQELQESLPFDYDLEKIVADWIFMRFFIANDYIPNLPQLHLNTNMFSTLCDVYKKVLPTFDGYINEGGILNLQRFQVFLQHLAEIEKNQFRELNNSRHVLDHKDDDEEIMDAKFSQYKRNYYINKLKLSEVTPDVLKSQTEAYILALQWILNYYYKGCCSWSWYYPYHYAPYISDINNFKDLKITFDLDAPFKPFEQLMAILPSGSKELVPETFRHLMTSSNSPIIDYYPKDFVTDLNNKLNDWEAVVLLPFIDSKKLLNAMKPCYERLSPNEVLRNTVASILMYDYTVEDLGERVAPACFFANIQQCHAKETVVPYTGFSRFSSLPHRVFGSQLPNPYKNMYFPGFPILDNIKYSAKICEGKVQVFPQAVNNEHVLITICHKIENEPPTEQIADALLGKVIWVGWPHLLKAKVKAVANKDYKFTYTVTEQNNSLEDDKVLHIDKNKNTNPWNMEFHKIREHYIRRLGIATGFVKTLIHVAPMKGYKYCSSDSSNVYLRPEWYYTTLPCAFQTVLPDIKSVPIDNTKCTKLSDLFVKNDKVFVISGPYYGCLSRVVETATSGDIIIDTYLEDEPLIKPYNSVTSYIDHKEVIKKCGIPSLLFSKITDSLYVTIKKKYSNPVQKNIGLVIRNNEQNMVVPGYTTYSKGKVLYSQKAVVLICEYIKKFQCMFERLAMVIEKDEITDSEIFPNDNNSSDKIMEAVNWLNAQPNRSSWTRNYVNPYLEPDEIKYIEESVRSQVSIKKMSRKTLRLQVPPNILYKPCLNFGNLMPDAKITFYNLYDRVICVNPKAIVPFGLKGIIVAISPFKPCIGSFNIDTERVYDVLFDQDFPGGLDMDDLKGHIFTLTASSLINITAGRKQYQNNNKTTAEKRPPKIEQKQTHQNQRIEALIVNNSSRNKNFKAQNIKSAKYRESNNFTGQNNDAKNKSMMKLRQAQRGPAPTNLAISMPNLAVMHPINGSNQTKMRLKNHAINNQLENNSKVFVISGPHYGSLSQVVETATSGDIIIDTYLEDEPLIKPYNGVTPYMDEKEVIKKCGIPSLLFSRITDILIVTMKKENSIPSKMNIGLAIQIYNQKMVVPGYTTYSKGKVLYSQKAVVLICEYIKKFQRMFERLAMVIEKDKITDSDIFPGDNNRFDKIMEAVNWLNAQPFKSNRKQNYDYPYLEPEEIKYIEESVRSQALRKEKTIKVLRLQVQPNNIYKPSLNTRDLPPDANIISYNLHDRVVCVNPKVKVPLGLKGIIIAISPPKLKEKSSNVDTEQGYDVLFDEYFLGGRDMGDSKGRIFTLTASSLINITAGRKQYQNNNKTTAEKRPPEIKQKQTHQNQQIEPLIVNNSSRNKNFKAQNIKSAKHRESNNFTGQNNDAKNKSMMQLRQAQRGPAPTNLAISMPNLPVLHPINGSNQTKMSLKNHARNNQLENDNRVFVISGPHYGSLSQVVETASSGDIIIDTYLEDEPLIKPYDGVTPYMDDKEVIKKCGIPSLLFSKITDSLYVTTTKNDSSPVKINLGLVIQNIDKNMIVPGYTIFSMGKIVYSHKAMVLICEYVKQFQRMFERLAMVIEKDEITDSDVFPNDNKSSDKIMEAVNWLNAQPFRSSWQRDYFYPYLEPDEIKYIEESIRSQAFCKEKTIKVLRLQVQPNNLYKPFLKTGDSPADPSIISYNIHDRVVCVNPKVKVPLGLKGIIVGISSPTPKLGSHIIDTEPVYDVLFDQAFSGGLDMDDLKGKFFGLTASCLINITHGRKQYENNNKTTAEKRPPKIKQQQTHQNQQIEALTVNNSGNSQKSNETSYSVPLETETQQGIPIDAKIKMQKKNRLAANFQLM